MSGRPYLDVIVKIGGSAITHKDDIERLKPTELNKAATCIRKCYDAGLKFIIVHGAGSFGHLHAKKFKVNEGVSKSMSSAECSDKVLGFSRTRQSVQKLNQLVVASLLDLDVPVVGCSPGSSWVTDNRQPVRWQRETLIRLLDQGFVPVLHGDCCVDDTLCFCILSGDTIIKTLCANFDVRRVVFMADVEGIYDKPPSEPGAQLLKSIVLNSDGSLKDSINTSQSSNDVTGGILLKLKSAIDIVLQSDGTCPVYVCSVSSPDTFDIIHSPDADLTKVQCSRISLDDKSGS